MLNIKYLWELKAHLNPDSTSTYPLHTLNAYVSTNTMAPTPFEIRTYTLSSQSAAQKYAKRWQAHVPSLETLNINTIGVWTAGENQVVALVRYKNGDDPREMTGRFLQSQCFKNDMKGFDMKTIMKVESTLMASVDASPLK